jgi:hypothetical protein
LAKKIEDVTQISYEDLNTALLECDDLMQLNKWLSAVVASGVLYRALRVHGRLNAVRRAQEVQAIKKTCMAAQKVRKVA